MAEEKREMGNNQEEKGLPISSIICRTITFIILLVSAFMWGMMYQMKIDSKEYGEIIEMVEEDLRDTTSLRKLAEEVRKQAEELAKSMKKDLKELSFSTPTYAAVYLGGTLGKKQSLTIPLNSINFPQQRTEEIDGKIVTGYFVGNVIKLTNKETGEEFFLNNGEPVQAGQDYILDSPLEGVYRVDILPYYDFEGTIMQDPRNAGFMFAEFEFQPGPPEAPKNLKIIIK